MTEKPLADRLVLDRHSAKYERAGIGEDAHLMIE
jgi:hypothetical protein